MIHTEAAYLRSLKILQNSAKGMEIDREKMEKEGLSKDQIKRVLDPSRGFLKGIEADVAWYERAKKGEIPLDESLETIGRILVALRISKGMTQEDLAKKLDVNQSVVSRDEEDEYHAISVERAQKILAVFGFEGRVIASLFDRSKAA